MAAKGNKRARKAETSESVNIDGLLKKQEQTKFSHAIENEKDIEKIDFEKIEQLIANQLAGTKEEKASNEDCEDQPGIPSATKSDVVFLNECSPFGWQWVFNDRTVRNL